MFRGHSKRDITSKLNGVLPVMFHRRLACGLVLRVTVFLPLYAEPRNQENGVACRGDGGAINLGGESNIRPSDS